MINSLYKSSCMTCRTILIIFAWMSFWKITNMVDIDGSGAKRGRDRLGLNSTSRWPSSASSTAILSRFSITFTESFNLEIDIPTSFDALTYVRPDTRAFIDKREWRKRTSPRRNTEKMDLHRLRPIDRRNLLSDNCDPSI